MRAKVASEQKIQKRHEQDVNVTRTNEDPKVLRDNIFIRKVDPHQPSGDNKNNKNDQSDAEVQAFHMSQSKFPYDVLNFTLIFFVDSFVATIEEFVIRRK